MNPHDLPVYKEKDRILSILAQHQVIVVESPTGSGKTTQLPLILHEAGYAERGVIGITQPRRIAAVSVSGYIARQLGVSIPGVVGYKMRFEDHTTAQTRMKVMTDGTLLQEVKGDPTLSAYSVMMVDEAHERSLNIDFILGLLKNALRVRKDLKVIISSATINAQSFSTYFDDAPVVHIDTASYPVDIYYEPPAVESEDEALTLKVVELVQRCLGDPNWKRGDILVFLSGEKIIKETHLALAYSPAGSQLWVVPIYGRLSKEEQDKVFDKAPEGKIKVVLATNIAETSITIEGITTVIDSGRAKINFYNPRTFTSSLVESPISKASAQQRKGRAGRTQSGVCYRLYTQEDFDQRPMYTTEEIYRTDLSEVVLRMAELGIREFDSFDFLSPPGKQGIAGAVETLNFLEALAPDNSLSAIGKMMAQFPLLPRHSRIIVEAVHKYPDVIREVTIAAAFLSTDTPFLLPQGEEMEARRAHHNFRDPGGDFVSYLKIFDGFLAATNKEKFCEKSYLDLRCMQELVNVQGQLEEIVSRMGVPISGGGKQKDYLVCVAKGMIQFVCISSGKGAFRSLTAEKILIHPSSGLFKENPPFIVAGEIVRTTRMYARSVSPIRKEWLGDIQAHLFQSLLKAEGHRPRQEDEEDRGAGTPKLQPWQIQVGREIFTLRGVKGKEKVVIFTWDKLSKVLASKGAVPDLKNLKGEVDLEGCTLLSGTRANKILDILQKVDPVHQRVQTWPSGITFTVKAKLRGLAAHLNHLMYIAPIKPGSKALGFLALMNDGHGQYWLRVEKNFSAALGDSLGSLENLADDAQDLLVGEEWKLVNATYRRLDDLL